MFGGRLPVVTHGLQEKVLWGKKQTKKSSFVNIAIFFMIHFYWDWPTFNALFYDGFAPVSSVNTVSEFQIRILLRNTLKSYFLSLSPQPLFRTPSLFGQRPRRCRWPMLSHITPLTKLGELRLNIIYLSITKWFEWHFGICSHYMGEIPFKFHSKTKLEVYLSPKIAILW